MIDDQLPADARALLAAGRDRMGPDAATVARLRARVEGAVIVGATATAASASAATATGTANAASASAAPATGTAASATAVSTTVVSVAAKSIAVKLVVLAAVGTSAYVAHGVMTSDRSKPEVAAQAIAPPRFVGEADNKRVVALRAPDSAPPSPTEVAPALTAEPPAPAAVPRPTPEATSAEVSPISPRRTSASNAASASMAEPPRRASAAASKPSAAPVEANQPAATLSREIELVDRATLAVRGGDLDAALASLRTYAAETAGHGQLAQDAAALRIEVLCRLHDAGAIGELAVFDKRWPRSPQRSRLAAVCTEVSK